MSGDVAVIVVSFNTRELLRECLSSLALTTPPLQTWVVDNGSSDGSPALVRSEFPAARLLEPGANLGFASANNLALAEVLASGEIDWCLLLNPDARLTPGALETLLAFGTAHPQAAMVAPRLRYPDGTFQAAAFRFPTLLMVALDIWPPRGPGFGRLYHHPLNGRYREDGGAAPFAIDHPLGAAMLVRTVAIRHVGGLDSAFWLYAEEVEWCWRLRKAGWEIWQVPAATVIHHGGASSGQFRTRSFLALQAARAQLYQRIHPPRWLRAYRVILRLAQTTHTLEAWWAWRRGRLDSAEVRRRAWAWASAVRTAPLPAAPPHIPFQEPPGADQAVRS